MVRVSIFLAPVGRVEGVVGETTVGGLDPPAAESNAKAADNPAASVRMLLRVKTAGSDMSFPLSVVRGCPLCLTACQPETQSGSKPGKGQDKHSQQTETGTRC
jgi:hypothetical protein